MNFSGLLRHEFLVRQQSAGGTPDAYEGWLQNENQRARIRKKRQPNGPLLQSLLTEFIAEHGSTAPIWRLESWLLEEAQRERRKEGELAEDAKWRREIVADWHNPFPVRNPSQRSLPGCAAPGGFRYEEPNRDKSEKGKKIWISVLFEYSHLWQWNLSLNVKQASVDADQSVVNTERSMYNSALERAHGNLFARCIDVVDQEAAVA